MKLKKCAKKFLILLTMSICFANKVYAQNIDKLYEKIDLFSEVLEKIQNEYRLGSYGFP